MFFTYSISMEGGVKYEKIIVFKFLFGGNKYYLGFYSVNDKFADFRNNKKCKYITKITTILHYFKISPYSKNLKIISNKFIPPQKPPYTANDPTI